MIILLIRGVDPNLNVLNNMCAKAFLSYHIQTIWHVFQTKKWALRPSGACEKILLYFNFAPTFVTNASLLYKLVMSIVSRKHVILFSLLLFLLIHGEQHRYSALKFSSLFITKKIWIWKTTDFSLTLDYCKQ